MDTRGLIAPRTAEEARQRYAELGPAAQVVVKETAKAMAFDADEYRERVTSDVVETARDALFASLLEVEVGSREEYETWLEGRDVEVTETGSEHVDRVVWHLAPFADEVAAATFQDEESAAVGTLRRQAFGRIYRDVVAPRDPESTSRDGEREEPGGDG